MGFEIKYEGVVSSYHEEDEITDIVIGVNNLSG